jgi:hypothetical protein
MESAGAVREREAALERAELRLRSGYTQLEEDRQAHIAALERWAAEMREREAAAKPL